MKRYRLPVIIALACAAASQALAENNPATRLSMKGLDAVGVAVQPIHPTAEKDGLSGQQLQAAVATRLRGAGVGLLASQQRLEHPRRPELLISVTTARLDTDEYLYSVRLDLVQWVASLDDPTLLVTAAIPLPASTWSPPSVLGITPTETLHRDVEAAILPMVDEFIDAFEKANPQQTALRKRATQR